MLLRRMEPYAASWFLHIGESGQVRFLRSLSAIAGKEIAWEKAKSPPVSLPFRCLRPQARVLRSPLQIAIDAPFAWLRSTIFRA
jgi:hypothetical protein